MINHPQSTITLFDSDSQSSLSEYKPDLEKITDELGKYGLTKNESKMFMFLGKYGSKTALEISKTLDLPRGMIYQNLNSLQNKGIVMTEFSHPTKFSVIPLKKAILTLVNQKIEKVTALAQREEKLVEMWNKIPLFITEKNESKPEKFQMLQGPRSINNKISDMLQTAKEDFRIFGSEKDIFSIYHADILKKLDESRLDFKLLISPASRPPFFVEEIDQKKIKIMPNNSKGNQFFLVKDSDEVLIFLRNTNHPIHHSFAFWANSPSLINSMKLLFDLSWQKSTVVH